MGGKIHNFDKIKCKKGEAAKCVHSQHGDGKKGYKSIMVIQLVVAFR